MIANLPSFSEDNRGVACDPPVLNVGNHLSRPEVHSCQQQPQRHPERGAEQGRAREGRPVETATFKEIVINSVLQR